MPAPICICPSPSARTFSGRRLPPWRPAWVVAVRRLLPPRPRGWHLNQGGWQLNAPDGATVALNQAERTSLGMLFRAGGELVPGTDDGERLADGEDDYDPHRLDMLIYRLRGKVETAGMPALPLRVVRGRGYVFIAGPEA